MAQRKFKISKKDKNLPLLRNFVKPINFYNQINLLTIIGISLLNSVLGKPIREKSFS